ncbi:MAG: hypothetical protein HKN18_10540 [Silicimonas sp.]|nr:hypothetical protein [Silicimonas sp.]
MGLGQLFCQLATVFDGDLDIERNAAAALVQAAPRARDGSKSARLPSAVRDVLLAPDAHPVCSLIAEHRFDWAPPTTSDDPLFVEHSLPKVHVELLGPGGLVHSSKVRLGLYGMLPEHEYGLRTHPAEEVFVMLAGQVFWRRGDNPYVAEGPGGRSYHPSMLPHSNKTGELAFMSVYVWQGDIDTGKYDYQGIPDP